MSTTKLPDGTLAFTATAFLEKYHPQIKHGYIKQRLGLTGELDVLAWHWLEDDLHRAVNAIIEKHSERGLSVPDTIAAAAEEAVEAAREYFKNPAARYHRVIGLILSIARDNDPGPLIYHYVDAAGAADASGEIRDKLARALIDAIERLQKRLEGGIYNYLASYEESEGNVAPTAADGMLWLDKVAIDWLEAEGFEFKDGVEDAREKARQRWENQQDSIGLLGLWTPPSEAIPTLLGPIGLIAKRLWESTYKSLERNAAAVPVVVLDTIEETHWRPGRKAKETNPNQLGLFSAKEDILASTPWLPDERFIKILEAGADILRTPTAQRLLIFLVHKVHEQEFLDHPNSHIVAIEGGFRALADAIGARSKRDADALPRILEAGHSWRIEWPGGEAAGLWTYIHNDRTGPGRPAFLEIRVGAPLAPHYGRNRLRSDQRILTPIVELAPMVMPYRYYPEQGIFQQLLVREIVERRLEVARHGGALLGLSDLWRTAERIGLPKSTMIKVLDRWQRDDDDGPAFLERISQDRYHLADNERYGQARRFIDATARLSERNSRRGKASARKRKK